jgi:hypothetical protein
VICGLSYTKAQVVAGLLQLWVRRRRQVRHWSQQLRQQSWLDLQNEIIRKYYFIGGKNSAAEQKWPRNAVDRQTGLECPYLSKKKFSKISIKNFHLNFFFRKIRKISFKKIEAKKFYLRVLQVVVLRLKGTKKSKKATNHDNYNIKWPVLESIFI